MFGSPDYFQPFLIEERGAGKPATSENTNSFLHVLKLINISICIDAIGN